MNRPVHLTGLHLAGALALAGWAALALASHRVERPLGLVLGLLAAQWLVFLAAWRAAGRGDPQRGLPAVLGWSAVFLACGLFATPLLEDDYFRFLWDGRQFATTGNPYASTPAAHFGHVDLPPRFEEILDHVNYPHVPTIYGPVCQFGFVASYWIAPGQLWPWKLLLAAAQLGLLLGIVGLARRKGSARPGAVTPAVVHAALLIGWCPLLVFETGFNAHPDVLGVALLVLAMLARARGALVVCGVLCGLAFGAKVFAVLLAPFLLLRSVRGWGGFAAAVTAVYAPFWVQGSAADLGGLVAFAQGWEFNSSVYGLLRWLGGMTTAKVACGGLFGAVWLWLFLRWRAQLALSPASWPPGLAVFGGFLLLSAVVNPWYLLWLAPFVALRPSWTGFAALALVSLSYVTGLNLGLTGLGNFEHPIWVRWVEYGGLALVGLVSYLRRAASR